MYPWLRPAAIAFGADVTGPIQALARCFLCPSALSVLVLYTVVGGTCAVPFPPVSEHHFLSLKGGVARKDLRFERSLCAGES